MSHKPSTVLQLHDPASCRAASRHASRWSALTIVVATQFMCAVDAFTVNVALPSIPADAATMPPGLRILPTVA
jgi:hypothetical protein